MTRSRRVGDHVQVHWRNALDQSTVVCATLAIARWAIDGKTRATRIEHVSPLHQRASVIFTGVG